MRNWFLLIALAAAGCSVPAPEPEPVKMSGSRFCALEDLWGNSDWRPCTDAMTWDI